MKNKARVHRLPTEDDSPVSVPFLSNDKGVIYTHKAGGEFRRLIKIGHFKPQHLYITTDEEIKEGDKWVYDEYLNKVIELTKELFDIKHTKIYRKIIATTDPKLITCQCRLENGDKVEYFVDPCDEGCTKTLPQIPQSFIEEYCKAGGIDEVLIEHEFNYVNTFKDKHGMQYKKRILVSKLDSGNCIIIHPVEEKKYSREEIIDMISEFELVNPKLVSDGHGEFPDTYQFGEKNVIRFVDKYLK